MARYDRPKSFVEAMLIARAATDPREKFDVYHDVARKIAKLRLTAVLKDVPVSDEHKKQLIEAEAYAIADPAYRHDGTYKFDGLAAILEKLGVIETEPSPEDGSLTRTDITKIVVASLFMVHGSKADIPKEDLIVRVCSSTNFEAEQLETVFTVAFGTKENDPYLKVSEMEGREVELATYGVWMLEDAFTQGQTFEEGMQQAERILAQTKFFSTYDKRLQA